MYAAVRCGGSQHSIPVSQYFQDLGVLRFSTPHAAFYDTAVSVFRLARMVGIPAKPNAKSGAARGIDHGNRNRFFVHVHADILCSIHAVLLSVEFWSLKTYLKEAPFYNACPGGQRSSEGGARAGALQ